MALHLNPLHDSLDLELSTSATLKRLMGSVKVRRKIEREKRRLGPLTCWAAPDLHAGDSENSELL
jgi:hypothetical protein